MRHFGSLAAATGTGVVWFLACSAAHAAPGGTVYGFGDSLLDLKNVCPIEYPSNSSGACGNGKGLLQTLPSYAPYSFSLANDYAAGGAGTGSFNVASVLTPNAIGTLTQIDNFAAAGGRIGGQDLVLVSGRNNFYQFLFNPSLQGASLATQALGQVREEISGLVSVGARDIIYFDSRSPNSPSTTQVNIYETNFSAGLPSALAGYAQPGIRLRLLNLTGLSSAVASNPTLYAFTSGASCATTAGCETASAAVQDEHFLYDQHPTEAGYALIAQYIANLDASANGIAAQADVAAAASNVFSATLLDQATVDGLMPSKRGLFIDAGYSQDQRESEYTSSGGAAGYSDGITRVVTGYSVPIGGAVIAGVAAGYTHSNASLYDDAGSVGGNSYSGGAYLDWRHGRAFIDTTIDYTHDDLSVVRPGVIGDLTAKPEAWTVAAQVRGGWLKEFGAFQLGPIATLNYNHTQVRGYTEEGDPLLAQIVSATTETNVVAGAGGRLEMMNSSETTGGFIEVSANHNFENGQRVLQTANIYAATLPIYTVVNSAPTARNFGLIDTVITSSLTSRIQFNLRAGTSFGPNADNYVFQAGIRVLL